jgi:hypothetical protein
VGERRFRDARPTEAAHLIRLRKGETRYTRLVELGRKIVQVAAPVTATAPAADGTPKAKGTRNSETAASMEEFIAAELKADPSIGCSQAIAKFRAGGRSFSDRNFRPIFHLLAANLKPAATEPVTPVKAVKAAKVTAAAKAKATPKGKGTRKATGTRKARGK